MATPSRYQSDSSDRPAKGPDDAPNVEQYLDRSADNDDGRLEPGYLCVQRDGVAGRTVLLLPPLPKTTSADKDGSSRRRDTFNRQMPPVSALQRAEVAQPTGRRRRDFRRPLYLLIAAMIAGPIAYYVSVRGLFHGATEFAFIKAEIRGQPAAPAPRQGRQPSQNTASQDVPSQSAPTPSTPSHASSQSPSGKQAGEAAADVVDRNSAVLSPDIPPRGTVSVQGLVSSQPTITSAPSAGDPILAVPPPGAGSAPTAPADNAARKLSADEIKFLTDKGRQLMATGDLVSARLVFRRAAEAGDATAALAMGTTYDPAALMIRHVRGLSGDLEAARTWYQRAAALGSAEASRRLDLLAKR